MKIKFCGAAQTVTGSCHLLTLNDGAKILLDCGLYQGSEDDMEHFNKEWMFHPTEIDVLILSHAHIDHCGRIPKLVKDGFKGKIFCTHATRDLAVIMLMDSAHIQEKDAEYESRKTDKKVKPLYTSQDVRNALPLFVGIGYNKFFKVHPGVEVKFNDAGHILGSATVSLKIRMDEYHEKIFGFTGDIGRPNRPILKDPEHMPHCDYLICESTYGGERHPDMETSDNDFLRIILQTCVENKGKLIIPAFSVGRTQELVFKLDRFYSENKLPKIKVFVDSPLAVNATEIFKMHPECLDEEIHEYMRKNEDPFGFNTLTYVSEVEQSKRINDLKEPAIIISASGMAQAGRIKHHIFNNIEDSKNTILIVGYCAVGTLGEQLVKRPTEVKIFGKLLQVRANIEIMSSMSAHADHDEILDFLSNQDQSRLKKIFLVHGELKRQERLQQGLLAAGFKNIEIPDLGNVYNI